MLVTDKSLYQLLSALLVPQPHLDEGREAVVGGRLLANSCTAGQRRLVQGVVTSLPAVRDDVTRPGGAGLDLQLQIRAGRVGLRISTQLVTSYLLCGGEGDVRG